MRIGTILLLAAISSFCFLDTEAAPIHRSKTYRKIDGLLNSVQSQITHELGAVRHRLVTDHRSHNNLLRNIKRYQGHVSNMRKHLVNARRSYSRYHVLRIRKINEQRQLLRSLRRQRVYIRQERRYIGYMERESLRLRRYSKQYKVIRREILQMRVQVNKEIRDVVKAYNILLSKVKREKHQLSRGRKIKRNQVNSYNKTYYRLLGRYRSLHRRYKISVRNMLKRKNVHLRLKKELEQQLDLLNELRTVLVSLRSQHGRGWKRRYVGCMRNFRLYRRKVRAANCTL
jgi:chromosome segregation ATPase